MITLTNEQIIIISCVSFGLFVITPIVRYIFYKNKACIYITSLENPTLPDNRR
jgi:hypothetical protein